MVFANSQGPAPAMNMAFPDVCVTPYGPVTVPTPYPNISMSTMAIPTQFKTLHMATPAHNLSTTVAMSNGDNAGVLLNPISGMFMGPTRHLMGSFKTFYSGMPGSRMLSMAGQNGASPGAFGTCISPSQFKVMLLA